MTQGHTGPELYAPNLAQDGRPIIGYLAFEPVGFVRVHCREIDGLAVLDGDIVLGAAEHMRQVEALVAQHGPSHFEPVRFEQLHPVVLAAIETSHPWPDRKIYYSIDSSLPNPSRVTAAIANWQSTGYFAFYDIADNPNTNYILFESSDDGTYSNAIGMKGGEQGIFLSSHASAGNATHEIGHAIGLNHEQKRRDTASFLDIIWSNLPEDYGTRYQFLPYTHGQDEGPYNYGSIMQYSSTADAVPSGATTLEPCDPNAYIGQRDALSVGDINGALAIYDIVPQTISIDVTTGTNGTDGDVYLGLGGREFLLDTSSDDFQSDTTETFTLGTGSNVENASDNDPQTPALTINRILGAPAYIRLAGSDSWKMSSATVTVTADGLNDPSDSQSTSGEVQFQAVASDLHLGDTSCLTVSLESQPPSGYSAYQPTDLGIQSMTATISTGSSGTDGDVYLGMAGREFKLDTSGNDFQSNSTDTFVLGNGATVSNKDRNDPRRSNLTQHDLDTYPMYLRLDGTDGWDLSSAVVIVATDDLPVTLLGEVSDLYLDDRAGRFCYLKFNSAADSDLPIQSISVTVETGDDGTDDDVYLGIAGREFKLDTSDNNFQSNTTETFTLGGTSANVENASLNDPTSPQLDLLGLDTYPIYLRLEGSDGWDLSSVTASVTYLVDPDSNPTTETVNLEGTLSDLQLSPEAGLFCSLIRS